MSINENKLLKYCADDLIEFCRDAEMNRRKIVPEIVISLKEYAEFLGYDVEEHATNTSQEARLERKRAKSQLYNAYKEMNRDLGDIHLFRMQINSGKSKILRSSPTIIYCVGFKDGRVKLGFGSWYVSYLMTISDAEHYDLVPESVEYETFEKWEKIGEKWIER